MNIVGSFTPCLAPESPSDEPHIAEAESVPDLSKSSWPCPLSETDSTKSLECKRSLWLLRSGILLEQMLAWLGFKGSDAWWLKPPDRRRILPSRKVPTSSPMLLGPEGMAPVSGSAGVSVTPRKSSASSTWGVRPGSAGRARNAPWDDAGELALLSWSRLESADLFVSLSLCRFGIVKSRYVLLDG